jgi:SnoaL-like domain
MHLPEEPMPIRSETERAAAIDRLLDRAELAELAARYARAVDRGDRDLLLSLYHADAIDHHGNDFCGSPPQFADYVHGATATFEVTAHYMLNSSYEIDGDRADGELYFVAYHRMRPPESDEIVVAGRYLDRYERRAGVWKIAHRSIAWDWASASRMTAQAMQLLRERGDGGGRKDDISRIALPLLARRR